MNFQANLFVKILCILHIFFLLLSFEIVNADDDKNKTSKNPKEWYYIKIPPKKVEIFGDSFIQTVYIFQNTDKTVSCIKNCPYKYPVWSRNLYVKI